MTARSRLRAAARRRGRAVEFARAALGVWHLMRAQRAGDQHPVLDRVLGVRQLAQAAVVLRAGTADAHTASALVDAAHGVTMVPLAVLDPRGRRFACGQLWIALALTIAEVAVVGRGRAGRDRVGGRR
ncbi:hypothetical protein SAMN02800687_0760 [Curtobacterium sp. UNCCL20]|uniref:hypothetical protein n=1 Tax=Curtobacterium sp. UNCCL20 TaxID=1502773 RepID=UPI000887C121|nr:hypothetical protein [Curtobacterium sp. UNCCL20]SDQ18732.1 hypothetical protein SAMN02800687_0760 [Curtobacterium sp. UNCCL20]